MIKITQKQADALEKAIEGYGVDGVMDDHGSDNWLGELEPLNTLYPSELAQALYTDYEVEPEFKRGQWIYDITDKNKTVIEVAYVTDKRVHGFWKTQHSDIDTHVAIENARHFTKEEIAKEKERIFFAKHGREPWELKVNDVLSFKESNTTYNVEQVGHNMITASGGSRCVDYRLDQVKKLFKVACFAENRLDVKTNA